MKNALLFLSICSISSFACGSSNQSQDDIHKPDADMERQARNIDVYSAVIDEFQGEFGSHQIFILNRSTFGRVSPDNSRERVITFFEKKLDPKISKELIDSFQEANNVDSSLPSKFDTKVPYTVVTEEQLPKVDELSDQRPLVGSLVEFSQIGFTKDHNHALVYITSYSGTRSGWGYYVVLAREENDWTVAHKFPAWVS